MLFAIEMPLGGKEIPSRAEYVQNLQNRTRRMSGGDPRKAEDLRQEVEGEGRTWGGKPV